MTWPLLVAIAAVIIILVAAHARTPAYGGTMPHPCTSAKCPKLGAGVGCASGNSGQFAWLSAGTGGIAVPAGLTQISRTPASDTDCVTETQCQNMCLDDSQCSMYTYNSEAVGSTPCTADTNCTGHNICVGNTCTDSRCPMAKSVCTLFAGALPATITTGGPPWTTAGIPSRLLPTA